MAIFDQQGGFQPFLQRNSNSFHNAGLGLLSGRNAQEQAAGAFQGFAQARQQNKTLEFLRRTNPELAQAVEAGVMPADKAFALDYEQKLQAQKPVDPFKSAGGSLYNTQTGEWITPPEGSKGNELGLNLVWGRDANGNTVAYQPSKSGGLVPVQARDGVQLSDPYYRSYEAASGAAQGKAQGAAVVSAPAGLAKAQQTIENVDALMNNPGLNAIVGSLDQYRPTWALGAQGNDALARLNQLQGGAFLQAFEMLKGGGAITEIEGQKAEQAVARLQRAQDEETFKVALKDFRDAVATGAEKIKAAASASGPVSPSPANRQNRTSTGVPWSVEQ